MATLTVNPGGGADYTTISAAIAAAGSTDIIDIQANIDEPVTLNKNVAKIYSSNENPIIWTNTNSNDETLKFLSGLTQAIEFESIIFNKTTTGDPTIGISTLNSNAQFSFYKCTFKYSGTSTCEIFKSAQNMGANNKLIFDRCNFDGSDGNNLREGLHFVNSVTAIGELTIKSCIFQFLDNGSADGAIDLASTGTVTNGKISRCTFANNNIGITVRSAIPIVGCAFVNNTDDIDYAGGSQTDGNFTYTAFD